MNQVIKINDLNKSIKKKVLFENSSFHIDNTGTITKITGEDLVGKTSLLQIISGLDTNYQGSYYLQGRDVSKFYKNDWNAIHENKLRFIPNDYNVRDNFSVYDNLKYSYFHYNKKEVHDVLVMFDLIDIKNKKAKKISPFEQAKLAVARGYLSKARILLFDEPVCDLEYEDALKIFDYFKILREHEYTIIYTCCNEYCIEEVDYHYKIENKKIILNKKNNIETQYILDSQAYDFSKQKKKNIRYIVKNYIDNFKYLSIVNLFMGFIVSFLLLVFGSMFYNVVSENNQQFLSIDPNYVLVSTQEYDDALGMFDFTDSGKLYFNDHDFEVMLNNDYVTNIIPLNYGIYTYSDYNDNKLNLSQSEKFNSYSDYSFFNFPIPNDAYGLISPTVQRFDFEVLEGMIPLDKSNEIMIPSNLADEFTSDYSKLIGQEVNLDVIDVDDNLLVNTYIISGVYDTLSGNESKYIYTSYYDRASTLSEPLYNYILNNEDINAFPSQTTSSYEIMKDAWGNGFSHALLYVPNEIFVKDILNEVSAKYPNIFIRANFQQYEDEFSQKYNSKLETYALYVFILTLIAGIISILIFSHYRLIKTREFLINYLNGYSYLNNEMSVLFDYFLNSVMIFIFAIMFLYLGTHLEYFDKYFNFSIELFNKKTFLLFMFMYGFIINIPLTIKLAMNNKKRVFRRLVK